MHVPCHAPDGAFPLQGRGRMWHSACMATDTQATTVPVQCGGVNADEQGLPVLCTARATTKAIGYPPLCRTHHMELCKHSAIAMARNVHTQGNASTVPEQGEGGPMHVACHEGAAPGIPRCPDTSISETATTTTPIGESPCTNFSAPDPELSDPPPQWFYRLASRRMAEAQIRECKRRQAHSWYRSDPAPVTGLESSPPRLPPLGPATNPARVACFAKDVDPIPKQARWVLDPHCPEDRIYVLDSRTFDMPVEPECYFYDPHPELESNWHRFCFHLRRFRTLCTRILNAFKEF